MTQQEHFDRSVAVLVKAFFEGELEQMSCAACACGNLIAAANGYSVAKAKNPRLLFEWPEANLEFSGDADPHAVWGQVVPFSESFAVKVVSATGYTNKQMRSIEDAFLDTDHDSATDKDGRNFLGLLAVVDVLAAIHGIDLTATTAAKALFVKA